MSFPPGASQGAPLDGTAGTGTSGCCPPQYAVNPGGLNVPVGLPSVVLAVSGVQIDDSISAEIQRIQGSLDATPPVLNGIAYSAGAPPEADATLLDLDTTPGTGRYHVVLSNECGCVAVVALNIVSPP